MIINWPELWLDPINLFNVPYNCDTIPKADCDRCKYGFKVDGQHCYMFRDKPGDRCGQFTNDV